MPSESPGRRIARAAVLLAPLAFAWPAPAVPRTWVSGVGDDANPCSRTAPCKTFAGAIAKTDAGGEIDTMDPGGFGAVTVLKSIVIDGSAGNGGIDASSTTGVTINAAGATVILRGLSIAGNGSGTSGIRFLAGASLSVEDCFIRGFASHGIDFEPATTGADLHVRGSLVANNGGAGLFVKDVTDTTLVNVSVEKSAFILNGADGLSVNDRSNVVTTECVFAANAGGGIATAVTAGTAATHVDHGVLAFNSTGIASSQTVRIADSVVMDNATAISGSVDSYGINRIAGNTAAGTAPNAISQQ